MKRPNTNYGIRIPSDDEIRGAFGSLARAAEITGGDLHTILFYLANPDRIDQAAPVKPQHDEVSEGFLSGAAAEIYGGMEKPTIVGVARDIGVCRSVARRLLVQSGKVRP